MINVDNKLKACNVYIMVMHDRGPRGSIGYVSALNAYRLLDVDLYMHAGIGVLVSLATLMPLADQLRDHSTHMRALY